MKVIGLGVVDNFKVKYPNSRKALDRWVKLLEGLEVSTPYEIKMLFGHNVDFVGIQAVFDVGGNKVRVITKIEYGIQVILVTHVLTHEEYDKNKWRIK